MDHTLDYQSRDRKIDPLLLFDEISNQGPSPYDLVGGTLNPSSLTHSLKKIPLQLPIKDTEQT